LRNFLAAWKLFGAITPSNFHTEQLACGYVTREAVVSLPTASLLVERLTVAEKAARTMANLSAFVARVTG
jgi:hypothetical protein